MRSFGIFEEIERLIEYIPIESEYYAGSLSSNDRIDNAKFAKGTSNIYVIPRMIVMQRYSTIVLASAGGATLVIAVMLLSSVFAVATKNYSIDVDPIKDNQNLFNTATVTNTGKLPLTNIVVIYGGTGANAIQKLAFLSSGEKVLLSPPESSILQSVTVTADHDVSVTKTYRTPIKIPGMMGS